MAKTIKFKSALKAIVESVGACADYLSKEGWAEASGGNISIDVSDRIIRKKNKSEQWLLVTRSGCRFRETACRPWKDVLLIRVERSRAIKVEYSENEDACPTSELPTHLLIHDFFRKEKSPGKAVIHTHPTYIIAMTLLKDYCQADTINRLLVSIHPEVKVLIPAGIGFVPYMNPGSKNIAIATIKAMQKHRVVIWEKHGCIAVDKDLDHALDLITIIEKAAKIFFVARSAGYDLQGLTQQQITFLDKLNK